MTADLLPAGEAFSVTIPVSCVRCGKPLGDVWPHYPHDPDCAAFHRDGTTKWTHCECPCDPVHPGCCPCTQEAG